MKRAESDPKFLKLPKWAQNHINVLERNLSALEESSTTFFANLPSHTRLKWFPDVNQDTSLPEHSRVEFDVGEMRVSVYLNQDGELCIQGNEPFAVRPQSSNFIRIEEEK